MSNSTWKSPFLLIPIILDALVVLMLPSLYRQWGLERTVILAVASMGAPWVLYFVVGRVLSWVARQGATESRESEENGFV